VTYDVVIVGAGPAGLSAALLLGRCRRSVLVLDSGQHRNAASRHLHAFLSRDGIDPREFLRLARADLEKYESVELRAGEAKHGRRTADGFEVGLADDSRVSGRKLVLASGVIDALPAIPGIEEMYGRSVFHCPYCDGWERRDQPLAILGPSSERGYELALELTAWSRDLVLCTDGSARLPDERRARLERNGILLREERILCLEGRDGILERLVFAEGAPLSRRAIFFASVQRQRSDLAAQFGCEFTSNGMVSTNEYEATNVPGLFVAGDASGRQFHIVAVAAAEGAKAAMAINTGLLKERLR
jgi:thioredoxin reductase